MLSPINPEGERIRAQAILSSFTEQRNAVNLFSPTNPQSETAELADNGRSIKRIFKAIKLSRRPAEPVQEPAYSPRQVTTTGCS